MKYKVIAAVSLVIGAVLSCLQAETFSPPEYIDSIGGSNYAFCPIKDEYLERNEPEAWWKPGILNHTVGTFHTQPEGSVKKNLTEMYKNGQRRIALVLWHINIEKDKKLKGSQWKGDVPNGFKHTYGHTLDSSGGMLCAQHQDNLKKLLKLIEQTGFESITIRFAPQGINNPMEWTKWEQELYDENLSFINSVKKIADKILKKQNYIFYDLGLELGGLKSPFCEKYTTRLWGEYILHSETTDTIGFSFAVEPGRVNRMLAIYKKSGIYPVAYPLDIYYDADQRLAYVIKEFRDNGIADPRLIIQETFYNDPVTLREIQSAAQEHDLTILYIMQWQVERKRMYWEDENGGKYMRHFSVSCPAEYYNYLNISK